MECDKLPLASFMREAALPQFKIRCIIRYGKDTSNDLKRGCWRTVEKLLPNRGIVLYNKALGESSTLIVYPASLTEYVRCSDNTRLLKIYDLGLREPKALESKFTVNAPESWDYSTNKVRTPKVKGRLILMYEILIG